MNIPIKQKETHRLVISKGREMEGRTGSLALADASCYLYDRMDGQQTSPVWHKKLYSVSYDKKQWKKYEEELISICI